MVLPRRNVVTAAVIGVALALASGVVFAQFDPIDNQDYPPDPFGGGGSGDRARSGVCRGHRAGRLQLAWISTGW